MPQELVEIVEARKRLQEKLHSIGVTPEHYDEVSQLIEEFRSSDLEQARNFQFYDTAHDMLTGINVSVKNVEKMSILLRNFAAHVTRQVLHPKKGELEEIVDTIPGMSDVSNPMDGE